jgi:hypothetical protein
MRHEDCAAAPVGAHILERVKVLHGKKWQQQQQQQQQSLRDRSSTKAAHYAVHKMGLRATAPIQLVPIVCSFFVAWTSMSWLFVWHKSASYPSPPPTHLGNEHELQHITGCNALHLRGELLHSCDDPLQMLLNS